MSKEKIVYAPTPEELDLLKRKYPKLNIIVITDEDNEREYHFVVKPIDRQTLSAAMHVGKEDSLAGAHVLAANTIVWGDLLLLDDAAYMMAFSAQQQKLMQSVTAAIKKN